MKRTFTTIMPDKTGALLKADKCITELGLNISRVSYNKAVDAHILFIEVEGDEKKLDLAEEKLCDLGYINNNLNLGNVILMEFKLPDIPGALLPVLELIDNYGFNISYISSIGNGSGFQDFKMGLFIENGKEISDFLKKAVSICPVRVLNYNNTERVLDNTVFYLSFAGEIADKMALCEKEKAELIINSNLIMQNLDEKNLPPYKTFDYIGKFCDYLLNHKNENYNPRISWLDFSGVKLILVEPPCGSNICVFVKEDNLIFVDSGFNLYKDELLSVLKEEIKDFDKKKKTLILTHSDVDHIGFLDYFDKVYLSENIAVNLRNVAMGKRGFREQISSHEPYVKISKLLSKYEFPGGKNFKIIGTKNTDELLSFIGNINLDDLNFEAYEGKGGHVRGETVFIERKKRIVFTGDLFINIKDCIKEQAEFNKIAPYLMTTVDSEPDLAREERKSIKNFLDKGEWTIIGGHGAPSIWNV